MKAIRLAGRLAALALMGAGLAVGWFGIAEMTMEKPSIVFWKMILPGVALILPASASRRRPGARNGADIEKRGRALLEPGPIVMAERTQRCR